MIFNNVGLTVNLTEMPEYKEYAEYYFNRNWLMRFLLRTFRSTKIEELRLKVQCALLSAILEKGNELIVDEPVEIPLATLDVMEHNARHTEP
jgi:hypothetical protein